MAAGVGVAIVDRQKGASVETEREGGKQSRQERSPEGPGNSDNTEAGRSGQGPGRGWDATWLGWG